MTSDVGKQVQDTLLIPRICRPTFFFFFLSLNVDSLVRMDLEEVHLVYLLQSVV